MFEDIEDIKDFLLWAKEEGIQKVKVADVEVEFTALAVLPQSILNEAEASDKSDPRIDYLKAQASAAGEEDDEDLFYSSGGI